MFEASCTFHHLQLSHGLFDGFFLYPVCVMVYDMEAMNTFKQELDHGKSSSLWLFNIAMENGVFIDDLPIKNGDVPWLC